MSELIARLLDRLARPSRGQTVVEYGLILTFLVLVVVVILGQLGQSVIPMFASAAAGF
jgi:Flp pilus assembly pilin Flp